jgi:hypothetical protein
MPFIEYDENNDAIYISYSNAYGKEWEVDVTELALKAVFRYLMARGLDMAEHCEYEVDGHKFRTSLVKEK